MTVAHIYKPGSAYALCHNSPQADPNGGFRIDFKVEFRKNHFAVSESSTVCKDCHWEAHLILTRRIKYRR